MTPKEWDVVSLSESTSKIGSGKTPLGGSSVYVDSGVLFIRSQNVYPNRLVLNDSTYITNEVHKKMKSSAVRANDVMLNITGASIGRCCIFPEELGEANVNQHVCLIRVKEKLNPKFVSYFLNSWFGQRQIYSYLTVGNREGLNFKQIGSFELPCPNINEQEKIATVLSTWDDAIEKLEKLIEAKKLRKKGLMQQLLTGKKRFDGFTEEWSKGKLVDFVSIDSDSLKSNTEADYKFHYISLSDVSNGKIKRPNLQISFSESPSRARKIIQNGDVLLSTVRPNLKAFAKIDEDIKDVVVSTGFAVLRPTKKITSSFLYHYILGDHITRQIDTMVVGSNYPAINTSEVKALHVNLPPIEEQTKIASVLDSSLSEISILIKKKELLLAQKKGLMQQLLTGKNRVKVD